MVALIYVVVGVVVLVLGTVLLKVVLAQSAQLMQRAPEYALKTRIGTPVWHGSGRRWSGSIYSTCSAARVSDPVGRKLVGPGVGRTSTRAGHGRGALRRRYLGPTFESPVMWDTVLLMAVIAGLGPQRIASVVFILSRTRPIRLLLAYVLGGFGMTLIFGGVILFVLAEAGVGPSSVVPPEIEIAVGMVALVVAALVASGLAARVRDRSRSRHRRERGVVAGGPPTSGRQRDVTQLPGYERMPR